jgi:hypothetical protein
MSLVLPVVWYCGTIPWYLTCGRRFVPTESTRLEKQVQAADNHSRCTALKATLCMQIMCVPCDSMCGPRCALPHNALRESLVELFFFFFFCQLRLVWQLTARNLFCQESTKACGPGGWMPLPWTRLWTMH